MRIQMLNIQMRIQTQNIMHLLKSLVHRQICLNTGEDMYVYVCMCVTRDVMALVLKITHKIRCFTIYTKQVLTN